MKKLSFFLILLLSVGMLNAQNKQLEKARARQYKMKMKEYKKEGWKLDSSSKTLEVALMEHYQNLKDSNNAELVGTVSNCNSINVCRQAAYNNAIITYANLASSYIKGRTASDVNINATAGHQDEEFDKLYAAYERAIGVEIKPGTIAESYALVREHDKLKEYKIIFLINEDKAAMARRRAMERAMEESKLGQQYATKVSEFINQPVK